MMGPPFSRGLYKSCRPDLLKKTPQIARKPASFNLLCDTELYAAQLPGFSLIALRKEKPSDTLYSLATVCGFTPSY